MASYALLAKGSSLKRKNPTTSLYEDVPQCTILNAPSITQDFDDITNHSSAGGFKEYVATLRDGGELSVEVVWDPINVAIHGTIYDDAVAEPLPLRDWKVLLPNGTSGWTFSAFITSPNIPLDFTKAIRAAFTLRISGQPVRVP